MSSGSSEALHLETSGDLIQGEGDDDEAVVGCFDFRSRTRSFDLHHLAQHQRIKKLRERLFRSDSESSVKLVSKTASSDSVALLPSLHRASSPHSLSSPHASPHASPHSSPHAGARRRFVRIVRDDQHNISNPHVIHKSSSADNPSTTMENGALAWDPHAPLPYTVSGHTILKKQITEGGVIASVTTDLISDRMSSHSPTIANKHASFMDEVTVIEFDKKCKIRTSRPSCMHRVRLHDSLEDSVNSGTGGPTSESPVIEGKEHILIEEVHTSHGLQDSVGAEATRLVAEHLADEPQSSVDMTRNQDEDMCRDCLLTAARLDAQESSIENTSANSSENLPDVQFN